MLSWLMRPFVLYPKGRRLLYGLLAHYCGFIAATVTFWWPPMQATGVWIPVSLFCLLYAAGAALVLHMLVVGMAPAEGMDEPTESDQGYIKLAFWLRRPKWKLFSLQLFGDEMRLWFALSPLLITVIVAVMGGAVVAIMTILTSIV